MSRYELLDDLTVLFANYRQKHMFLNIGPFCLIIFLFWKNEVNRNIFAYLNINFLNT